MFATTGDTIENYRNQLLLLLSLVADLAINYTKIYASFYLNSFHGQAWLCNNKAYTQGPWEVVR